MSVPFVASGNATPASGTIVATCTIGGEEYQLLMLADPAGVPVGASVVQGAPTADYAAAWLTGLTDGMDRAGVDSASRLLTAACVVNTACVIVTAGSVVVTNTLSASVAGGSVALLAGANVIGIASVIQGSAAGLTAPWPVRLSDGTDSAVIDAASRLLTAACVVNTASVVVVSALASPVQVSVGNRAGSAAGSPLFSSITNLPGSAVGSPLFVSVANQAGSAAGSPLFASVTNQVSASVSGGSVALLAGANTFGAASAIQGLPQTNLANAWPVRLVNAAGSNVGSSGSPLPVAYDSGAVWVAGSVLTVQQLGFSASSAGSAIVVAGSGGVKIRVLAATFTTSASNAIGWQSGSTGTGASKIPAMFFGPFGGMDTNRFGGGYFVETDSGSPLVISLAVAASVRGGLNYVAVPG